ncbi:MAG: hypothetical protein WC851_02895 [Candidatus Shapirobacteria bacterium]|jgi:hypothetical protein
MTNNFANFFQKFVNTPKKGMIITVSGEKKTVKAISLFTSLNYQKSIGNYYKIVFTDDSLLIIIPELQSVQYSAGDLGQIKTITDEMIGEPTVSYKGNTYKLENKHDYQFVLQKLVGGPLDIEGECQFTDYVNEADSEDSLSLAWIAYDGRRSDVHSHTIEISELDII